MQSRHAQLNVVLLVAANVLAKTTSIAMLAMSSLLAYELAGDSRLATLPMAMTMVTDTALKIPAAYFMQRYGRRAGFMLGASAAVVSALLATLAIIERRFALFVVAATIYGAYNAFNLYYSFAAGEAVDASRRGRAISWVVGGGIVAAIAGPALAGIANGETAGYARVFLLLAALGLVALLLLSRLGLAPTTMPMAGHVTRPLRVLLQQPAFMAAVVLSTAGYAVMTLIMGVTPLAMKLCGLSTVASGNVIQWHMLGMYLPSLFVGELIRRIGLLPVLGAGLGLLIGGVATGAAGASLVHFLVALTLLGVGWNFLFIGGSTLLLEVLRPGEQARAQGFFDFTVLTVASLASLGAGPVLASGGWQAVTIYAAPLLLLATLLLVWYWRVQRAEAASGPPQ